jgi:hypothetical protein
MPNRGYLLKSNLSEKQIEADVAGFFGWCTPEDDGRVFRLLDVNEQTTGADKLFDVVTPIYIQFKKSQGLKPITRSRSSEPNTPLNNIRRFRQKKGLECDPTLFFQLRQKAKTAKDFQHNVLLAHENPPSSRAIYVAPLILDKQEYAEALFSSTNRYLPFPFYRVPSRIHAARQAKYFGSVLFLREHVSIPPHQRVRSHRHYYAYSETGVDISWHSPQIRSLDPLRLSDFMMFLFSNAMTNPDAMISTERAATAAIEIGRELEYEERLPSPDVTPLERLQIYGRWLWTKYDIRQFILLGSSARLAESAREIRE